MPTMKLDVLLRVISQLEDYARKLRSAGGSDVHLRNSIACGLWYQVNDLRAEAGLPLRKWPVGTGELES